MRFNVHAGHGKDGSKSCGAVGLMKESIENRIVKDLVIKGLKEKGHTVFDCSEDYPSSKPDCINNIVSKCNKNKVDLDISIHFNSGRKDPGGDGKTGGVEVLVINKTGEKVNYAKRVCESISKLGFTDRGVKVDTSLGVLKNTKAPAILIECCFVDDKDDIKLYNSNLMANAIVSGLLDIKSENKPTEKNYAILYSNDADKVGAEILAWGIPTSTILDIKDYKGGYWGVVVVGGKTETELKAKYPNIKFTTVKGEDRFDTVRKCLNHIGK